MPCASRTWPSSGAGPGAATRSGTTCWRWATSTSTAWTIARCRDMNEVGDAKRVSRLVDVGLPAQVVAVVLQLHSDLPHLSSQFVVPEVVAIVVEHVSPAPSIRLLRDGSERAFKGTLE